MPRLIEKSLERNAICVRISNEAYNALREVVKARGGTVTGRAQELVEACKHVKPQNWNTSLASFEARGRGD